MAIGMIITALILSTVKPLSKVSRADIENMARGYGMEYPGEFKVNK